MFEIEAKVAISKNQHETLRRKLKKEASYLGARQNTDSYYKAPKATIIRIRKRKGAYTFDLKRRETIKGVESNLEMEWGIKDLKKWRSLLKKLKIAPDIKKTKTSELFKWHGFTVELNHIRQLGYFLEIEKLTRDRMNVLTAKKELISIFRKLGYSQKQFEKRPYLELLSAI